MVRPLLVRGMLAGLAAGLLAFAFAYAFGEPQVQAAIDFEEHLARLAHEPAATEEVSRGIQRTLGLLTGIVLMGIALGGVFALLFAWAYGRIGPLGARATAALLALGAFVTVTFVPFTKYPANPPTVGNPDTIDRRTVLFVAMICISLLAFVAAAAIFVTKKWPKSAGPLVIATLLLAIVSLGAGFYIAYAGGKIRHREFRNTLPPKPPPE